MKQKKILLFGVGELQRYIIQRAHNKGLFVVGIDPSPDALYKNEVDAFEIVGGQDFEGTLAVARKYNIDAVITAATDKPLVMMARVAKELKLIFYSVETAQWSTDKYQMKQRFIEGGVPCAQGRLIKTIDEADGLVYPIIVKPRDNSASRGVILCKNKEELQKYMNEAYQFTHLDSLLVEEFIEGQEYSIEGLHYNGRSEVIAFTEKTTTPFPYNVELGHKEPTMLTEEHKEQIREIVRKIGKCLNFENCPSHTELKINSRGIFVIETSPRTGGEFIHSHLVPLSTGISMEDQVLNMALGEPVDIESGRINKAASTWYFFYPEGVVSAIDPRIEEVKDWPNMVEFNLKLKVGDLVNKITHSLNRYGQFIVKADNREELDKIVDDYDKRIRKMITIR